MQCSFSIDYFTHILFHMLKLSKWVFFDVILSKYLISLCFFSIGKLRSYLLLRVEAGNMTSTYFVNPIAAFAGIHTRDRPLRMVSK